MFSVCVGVGMGLGLDVTYESLIHRTLQLQQIMVYMTLKRVSSFDS